MKSSNKNLDRNKQFYDYFINKKILELKDTLSDQEVVERIAFLAKFAWRNHSGYYYDGRLENILFDYGQQLDKYIDKKKVEERIATLFTKENGYTILHVATEIDDAGGHTRILYQFLKRYKDKHQIVLLTDQNGKKIPQCFVNDVDNITIVALDSTITVFERAYILRYVSTVSKEIILYHHPYDAVPIVAFSHNTCPPVMLLNHAHSWFWLGASITDIVLVLTKFHENFTLKTRPVPKVHYFPFTQLDDLEESVDQVDKLKAKKNIGLSSYHICIITIGTPEKFIPNSRYNFYKTAKKIIEQFENVELFVIGISENSHIRNRYDLNTKRFHLVGMVSDPSDYYKAADICLDALPQPSLGGTLFSTLIGMACPLYKYGAANVFNGNNFVQAKLYEQCIGTLKNEKEYLKKLDFLVNNPDIRSAIATEIREGIFMEHSKGLYLEIIRELLVLADNTNHAPRKIPDGLYYYDADSAEIADASSLQDLSSTFKYFETYLNKRDKIVILAHLSPNYRHHKEIFSYALIGLINKIKSLPFVLVRKGRSFYGPIDRFLSSSISSDSGK